MVEVFWEDRQRAADAHSGTSAARRLSDTWDHPESVKAPPETVVKIMVGAHGLEPVDLLRVKQCLLPNSLITAQIFLVPNFNLSTKNTLLGGQLGG